MRVAVASAGIMFRTRRTADEAAFLLAHAAPYVIGLAGGERELQALALDKARPANRLRLRDLRPRPPSWSGRKTSLDRRTGRRRTAASVAQQGVRHSPDGEHVLSLLGLLKR